ncbi:MAG: TolC family protein [Planctomycetes bacterium]|nr:TolC family protein [Planctomycetota bacterium]
MSRHRPRGLASRFFLAQTIVVIASAADRQMAHVRTFQNGQHSSDSQKILNEIAAAKVVLLNAEQNMVSARQRYEQTLDTFKIQLALATDTVFTLDPNELNLLEEEGIKPIPYSAEQAIEIALDRRLDLANTANQMEDTERKLVLAAEGLGVQVNLVGSANVGSTADTDWTRLRFHEGAYALGVETDLLLDRKAQRNAYRKALITVQQRQRAYDEQVDQIKLAVRQAYRNLAERAESYRIQQLALTLARERVEEEKLLLNIGRGTARLLLDSEDALVAAQDRVIRALVDHTIAKLSFFRDVGVLQVKPDGMWEQNTL